MHDYENEQNSGEGKETDEIDSSMTNHGINNNTLDNDLTYRQDKTTQENECANESRVDIETNIVLLAHKSKTEHTIELTGEKAGKENSKEDNSIKVDTRTEHHMNNNRNDNNQNNYHVETAADVIQVNNDQVNERISDNVSSNVEQNNANELHVDNNVCQIDKNEERYFVPHIKECLNRYVIVNVHSKPYSGLVQEVHNEEVEVLCMHQVERKRSTICFFWPKKSDLSCHDR
ncbi:myb-like protein D [Mya arenaria]|uniref:myb-like protein D n=1 Tax=Mya arenaria TaxID=6604 RepID=UPI0022E52895|nr:myb-like protein D [Mya arenaria]